MLRLSAVTAHDAAVVDGVIDAPPIPIAYVQHNFMTPTSGVSVPVGFPLQQTAGNFNIVVIGWDNSGVVESVLDSAGNTYARAGSVTGFQEIHYATNIAGGNNTVTVKFTSNVGFPDIRILEYSGIAATNPVDDVNGQTDASGGTQLSSGSITTTHAYDLLFAADTVGATTTAGTGGWTERLRTADYNIAEDTIVDSTGTYKADAMQSGSSYWAMQIVAFKGALDAAP